MSAEQRTAKCDGVTCFLAQIDGIICAADECDLLAGVRPGFLPKDDPSPYDWEDFMTEPAAVVEAVVANRKTKGASEGGK